MNLPVPTIIDTTYAKALEAGCDCVMLKHGGFPVLVNCVGEGCNILSTLTHLGPMRAMSPLSYKDIKQMEVLDKTSPLEPLSALLVGAKLPTSSRIFIYDMWWFDDKDIQMHSYRERYALARMNVRKLDERFNMVNAAPISQAHRMWSNVTNDPDNLKGLVFRRSKDSAAGELYVVRYYKELPRGLE